MDSRLQNSSSANDPRFQLDFLRYPLSYIDNYDAVRDFEDLKVIHLFDGTFSEGHTRRPFAG